MPTIAPRAVVPATTSTTDVSNGVSGQLPQTPLDAVVDVYLLSATGVPGNQICFIFSPSAGAEFAKAFGVGTCTAAIGKIRPQITDASAYASTSPANVPQLGARTVTVSSCNLAVSGGPLLGTFTVSKQDQGWEITGYQAQQPCS